MSSDSDTGTAFDPRHEGTPGYGDTPYRIEGEGDADPGQDGQRGEYGNQGQYQGDSDPGEYGTSQDQGQAGGYDPDQQGGYDPDQQGGQER